MTPTGHPVDSVLELLAASAAGNTPDIAVALVRKLEGERVLVLDCARARPPDPRPLPLPALRQAEIVPEPVSGTCHWRHLGRVSTRWTLMTGFRPDQALLVPLAQTDLAILLLAGARSLLPGPDALRHAVLVLDALQAQGMQPLVEREAASRVDALIQHLEHPVLFVEASPLRALYNRAAARLLGLEDGDRAPGEVTRALRHLLRQSQVTPTLSGDIAGGQPDARYHAWLEVDGRHWELLSQRISQSSIDGRLWTFTDVAAARQSERMAAELRRAETVNRLVGGVAHQFNNLLTVVMGSADQLLDYHAADSWPGRQLDAILAAADRGADIVRQLLAFNRSASARREPIEVNQALDALQPRIDQALTRGIRWHGDRLLPSPLWFEGDPALFADAVLQIVYNACDAMPKDGELSLGVSYHRADTRHGTDEVALRFVDNGEGMDADTLARAREPFFTTRDIAVARGLGLSVVEGFAQQAGGRLDIASSAGKGTEVTLYLPCIR